MDKSKAIGGVICLAIAALLTVVNLRLPPEDVMFQIGDVNMPWVPPIVLGILGFLAVYFPWELGQKADPFAPPPPVIRPEWYFMFAFQALKFLPAHVLFIEGELFGIIVFTVGGLIWTLIPLLDRQSTRNKRSRMVIAFGSFVVIFIIIMTILGYLME